MLWRPERVCWVSETGRPLVIIHLEHSNTRDPELPPHGVQGVDFGNFFAPSTHSRASIQQPTIQDQLFTVRGY
jgi:hypothetical protein